MSIDDKVELTGLQKHLKEIGFKKRLEATNWIKYMRGRDYLLYIKSSDKLAIEHYTNTKNPKVNYDR